MTTTNRTRVYVANINRGKDGIRHGKYFDYKMDIEDVESSLGCLLLKSRGHGYVDELVYEELDRIVLAMETFNKTGHFYAPKSKLFTFSLSN